MLHLGRVDQLGLVVVAGNANRLGVLLCQHDFSVFGRSVAGVAALVGKRRVHELCHQLGRGRLVRIVALDAVGRGERLILVSLLQAFILGIVAIQTERRSCLGQMEPVLRSGVGARLVGEMACVTAHVEGGVNAAGLGHIQTGLVTSAAEVLFFPA